MKNVLIIIIALCCLSSLFGQTPQKINYQGVARIDGEPISNQEVSLRISILKDATDMIEVYKEIHITETDTRGLFNIMIGDGNPINGIIQNVNWGNGSHFLQIELSETAGGDYQMMGTSQILSVPYALFSENGKQFSLTNQEEWMVFNGANGLRNVIIGARGDDNGGFNRGAFAIMDAEGDFKVYTSISDNNEGILRLHGANGNVNVLISSANADNPSNGAIRFSNEDGLVRAAMQVGGHNEGAVSLYGPNGQLNVNISSPGASNPNVGAVSFRDEEGNSKAGIGIRSDGVSYMYAEEKDFRIEHPADPQKSIWYSCLEGPEVGAYERGTATLVDGEVFIPFSEHFKVIINPSTTTVNLTPRSANTYGLAVVEQSGEGIRVKELKNGTGSFSFDWEFKAVRKGFESFEVIRDRTTDLLDYGGNNVKN